MATHDGAGGRSANPERLFAGAASLGEGAEGDGARARRSRADVVDVVVVEHVGDDDVAVEESVGLAVSWPDAPSMSKTSGSSLLEDNLAVMDSAMPP